MTWRCWFGHALSAPFEEQGRLKVRCFACAYVSPGLLLPSSRPVEPPARIAPVVDLAAYRQAQERRTA